MSTDDPSPSRRIAMMRVSDDIYDWLVSIQADVFRATGVRLTVPDVVKGVLEKARTADGKKVKK